VVAARVLDGASRLGARRAQALEDVLELPAAGRNARLGLWEPGEKEFGDEGGAHVHFAFSAAPGRLDALCERLRAQGADVRGPEEHDGGDRSLYVEDPEGNVVEVWDFFGRGKPVEELRESQC